MRRLPRLILLPAVLPVVLWAVSAGAAAAAADTADASTRFANIGAAVAAAEAEFKFPPPEFTEHQLPPTTTPSPREAYLEYLDVAALFVGLLLATYLAIVRRSRKGLFLLSIASLAWFGFWRKGCVCPIGATQNVTLALFDPAYTVPFVVVAFFVLPLIFTLFFGRTFCASVCPLGAVQELVAVRPVQVPAWVDHTLGLLAYVYLGAAVIFAGSGTAFVICRYDPFVGFFRLSATFDMLVLGGCFLVVGLFVGRPYCRYLCPYGAILGLLSKVSKWHVNIPPEDCINCRLCEESCPYGAIRGPTVPPPLETRAADHRRLVLLLLLFPLLVADFALLGRMLDVPLSRLHPTVRLAERIRLEATGQVEGTTDASDAFRNTGIKKGPQADGTTPEKRLYRKSIELRRRFALLGTLLGGWVGLVVGVKLIHLSIRRRREDYQADRANCVACGRCFWYCPLEQVRLGLIQDVSELVKEEDRHPPD